MYANTISSSTLKIHPYIKTYKSLIDQCRNPYEIAMITAISEKDSLPGGCFSRVDTLAKRATMSERQGQRVLKSFAERGMINLEKQHGKTYKISFKNLTTDSPIKKDSATISRKSATNSHPMKNVLIRKEYKDLSNDDDLSRARGQASSLMRKETSEERQKTDQVRRMVIFNRGQKPFIPFHHCFDLPYSLTELESLADWISERANVFGCHISRLRSKKQCLEYIEYAMSHYKSSTVNSDDIRSEIKNEQNSLSDMTDNFDPNDPNVAWQNLGNW
jgi:hypothetical protein